MTVKLRAHHLWNLYLYMVFRRQYSQTPNWYEIYLDRQRDFFAKEGYTREFADKPLNVYESIASGSEDVLIVDVYDDICGECPNRRDDNKEDRHCQLLDYRIPESVNKDHDRREAETLGIEIGTKLSPEGLFDILSYKYKIPAYLRRTI